jgi:hypothetical protein
MSPGLLYFKHHYKVTFRRLGAIILKFLYVLNKKSIFFDITSIHLEKRGRIWIKGFGFADVVTL